ncbi:MAG: DUF4062 domain-containing protein [Methanophagales archaeon]|nr:DUF4062 domain-containing protein [Methanophagales archaeon]
MQLKVFISSRLEELEEERAAVEEAVSELWTHGNLPFTIWRWESAKEIPSGKHPDKVQSEGAKDSDIYVLILGSKYGDFEYGQSPTHKEYDIACSELEEDCILIYIKEVEGREEKIEKWIEEIKDKHTPKPFKNPYQLKDLVKTRLRDLWDKGIWKVNIPTIQSVLRKGETFECDFFKKEPEWVDFEEGFIVERKEVDEIIKKLKNDNIQLVLGEPASGKSVILKNIGFKLAKENKVVYIVELKKHSRDEVQRYFEDIPEIKDEKAVFIIDDAHLQFADCERLARDFKNGNLKAKLIIGTRETREIRGEHPKEASEFEYLSKTEIHAEDVTEEMIKRFLKRKHHFSDERIKTISENLEYKKDLWHLSWALKAYNPEKDSVEEEEIYWKIKESIRDISAKDVFFPLSVFYRFEIPVERNFLEEQLELEEDKINELMELSEIIETEEIGKNQMLSLIHSSIAELYFRAYQAYPNLGRRIKKKILNQRDDDLQYCLFYKYMTSTDPRNVVDVVIHLRGDWSNEKGEKTLLKKLIEDDKIQELTVEGIDREEDTRKIGWCFLFIAKIKPKVAQKIAKRIEFNTLSTKLERGADASGNAICAAGFAKANNGRRSLKLVNIVHSKIEEERDVETIGWCTWSFAEANKELARQITNRINIETILTKIEKEADIRKIGWCIQGISKANRRVAREIVNRLNPKLREELQKEGG